MRSEKLLKSLYVLVVDMGNLIVFEVIFLFHVLKRYVVNINVFFWILDGVSRRSLLGISLGS